MDTGILAMTEKNYIPKVIDNAYNTTPFLAKLNAGKRSYDGGTYITPMLQYAELASGGSFTGLGLLDTEVNDIISQANYEHRQYYVTMGWSRRDYLINKNSKQKIVDMVEASSKNASSKLKKLLTTGIFQVTKAATTDIDGLVNSICATGATSCGGLTSTDFANWAPQRDTTTTKLTLAAMNTQERAASDGDDRTDIWVTTDNIYGFFYNIATPLERLENKDMANLGFTSLSFNGKPLVTDKACVANYLFGLNLNHLQLHVHQDEDMRYEKPVKPLNQAAELGQIFWMGNLVTDERRTQLIFSGITS